MNLTKTAKAFKISVVLIGIIIFVYYLMGFYIIPNVRKAVRDALRRRNPPNALYGVLPQLEFTEKLTVGKVQNFQLELGGKNKLPDELPDRIKVYKIAPNKFSYLAGKNAIASAELLGFTEKDLITDLKGTVYKWRNINTNSLLSINTDTKESTLVTAYRNLDSKNFETGSVTEMGATDLAIKFFRNTDRFDTTYESGSRKMKLGAFDGGKLYQVSQADNAQFIRIDFFRSVEGVKVYTPDPEKGNLNATLRSTPQKFYELESYYKPVDLDSTGEYPIISVDDAWQAVVDGKGVLSRVVPKNVDAFSPYEPTKIETIYVKTVSLGYYETPKTTDYLQPIYVFEGIFITQGSGGGEVTVYFPAITADYVKK